MTSDSLCPHERSPTKHVISIVMLHRTFLSFVFFQELDSTIFQVSTFPCRPQRRGILLSLRRRRGWRKKKFPSEAAFRWLLPWLNWQLRLRPIRRHVASFTALSLPSASLKLLLRIRNAKSFYFLPVHIRLMKYERHFYTDLCSVENCRIKSGARVN